MKLKVVGAGWAGLAAAITAIEQGWQVEIWESAAHPGGRARAIHHRGLVFDNGQHVLIGAYRDSLQLIEKMGLSISRVLHRQPLSLKYADGSGWQMPSLPPPWNLIFALLGSRGWSWRDKLNLLTIIWQWQLNQFICHKQLTVSQLCANVRPRVFEELIEPLCISALNTPVEVASAQIFLNVVKDSMMAQPGGSDLLIPKVDLGNLFPEAALQWLQSRGAKVYLGRRVESLPSLKDIETNTHWILACGPTESARLAVGLNPRWSELNQSLPCRAITTVYLRDTSGIGLGQAFLALRSHQQAPGQFVMDKGWLTGDELQKGLLAVVISNCEMERDASTQQVLKQLEATLGRQTFEPVLTIREKRATFSSEAGVLRPEYEVAAHVWACGDHIEGPYPATLEGAVRSGMEVIKRIQLQQNSISAQSDFKSARQ
jgi:squalene-associated FAD-dependent desaturase